MVLRRLDYSRRRNLCVIPFWFQKWDKDRTRGKFLKNVKEFGGLKTIVIPLQCTS
jgi:hypothetical protein